MTKRICLFVLLLIFAIPTIASAAALDNWHWRNPLPEGNSLSGIAYGNSTFVAVGNYGSIFTSTDKTTWVKRDSGITDNLNDVIFGNNIFLASGSGNILSSTDGITWIKRSSLATSNITFGNGLFVTANGDYVSTSSDGITWSQKATPTANAGLYYVNHANNLFVSYGVSRDAANNGTATIITSPDGLNWTTRTTGTIATNGFVSGGFSFGNGVFILIGNYFDTSAGYYKNFSITSLDGATWTKQAINPPWKKILFVNGEFFSIPDGNGNVSTSQDGITWTSNAADISGQEFYNGIYAAGTYIAVGAGGAIASSANRQNWINVKPGNRDQLNAIAYGNNTMLAVSNNGKIYTSTDGVSWNVDLAPSNINAVTYYSNYFIGVGGNGSITTSRDGVYWAFRQTNVTDNLNAVACGNNKCVAVGNSGTIFVSSDAVTWTKRSSTTTNNLFGITWGNGLYVAIGDNETILTSPDAITWTHRDTNFAPGTGGGRTLSGIAHGAGIFVITGGWPVGLLTSPDGVNWQQNSSMGNTYKIAYGNNSFIAIDGGFIVTSDDAITWTRRRITGNNLSGIVYNGSTFIVVGEGGTILQSDAADFSDPLDTWRWRNPLPEGNSLSALAYGNGIFVTVGRSGVVLTSTDKITWTRQNSGISSNISDITFGNGLFAAVGDSQYVLTSPDGVVWTRRASIGLQSVTYGNNLFVAVGWSNIATSPDGLVWTTRVAPSNNMNLYKVTFGNGLFVAVESNTRSIYTSTDGITWSNRYTADSTTNWLGGIAYGNGVFVVAGNNNGYWINLVSTDGVTWTQHVTNTPGNVNFVNGLFMCINSGGVMTSTDGITWESNSGISTSNTNALIYAAGAYVAAGDGGAIAYSTNGIKWINARSGFHDNLQSIAYGNNIHVAGTGNGKAYTSTDGTSWKAVSANSMLGLMFSSGTFVGVGCGSTQTSSDGNIWSSRQNGFNDCLKAVTYGNGLYVAVGDSGRIVTSPDTSEWTPRVSGDTVHLMGVAFGNGLFVAVGQNKTVLTSTDGITWTYRDTGINQNSGWGELRGVTYNAGMFVVAGQGGIGILTSPDGIVWTQYNIGDYIAVAYGNNNFIAVGHGGSMASSSDGKVWTQFRKTANNIRAVTFGRDNFIAVGDGGTILQSDAARSGTTSDTWHWRNPLPDGDNLYGLAYGNNMFVAVGSYGVVLTSADNITWIRRDSGITDNLNDVVYGNSQFVAVGCGGGILTSSDGAAWSRQYQGCFNGVAYGKNLFITVGRNQILASPDGEGWAQRTLPVNNPNLYGVRYANGIFVTFGEWNGKEIVMTSSDGKSWTTRYTGSQSAGNLGGFAYGNGIYAISGWSGDNGYNQGITLTSTDGVNWTKNISYMPWNGIGFADGYFRFVSGGGVSISKDGVSWTQNTTGLSTLGQDPSDLLYAAGTYVVVGAGGSIVLSNDGYSWAPVRSGFHDNLNAITYGNSTFVAVSGNSKSYASNDGISWSGSTSFGFNRVAFNNGTYIGVGWNGMIATSSDGLKWTQRTTGINDNLLGITFGKGMYVAVGSSGRILTSQDAIAWASRSSNTTASLNGVAYGNGLYVAVGDNEAVLTSADGITWTRHDTSFAPGSNRRLNAVIYSAGIFVAVGDWEIGIITSTNGIDWSQPYSDMWLSAIAYGNNTFAAVGGGWMVTSSDGINWAQKYISGNNLNGIAYGQGTFVIVGEGGTILQSATTSSQRTLYVTKTGSGGGVVTSDPSAISCGSSCIASFNDGSNITLIATPDTNQVFSGWSGGGCNGTGSCTISMNSDTTVVATFGDSSDHTPPAIAITSPVNNSTLDNLFFITGTSSDDRSGVSKIELQVTGDTNYLTQAQTFTSSTTWIPVAVMMDSWTFNSGKVAWKSGTTYTISARATDGAGNISNIATTTFTYTSVSSQAYTTLSLELSSQTIRQNDTITINGKLSRLPEIGSNLSSNSVIISVTDPTGAVKAYPVTTSSASGFFTTVLNSFNLKGGYLVQASFAGSSLLASSSSESKGVMVGASAGYAVIVQGKIANKEGLDSHNKTTNRVYNQLKARGFTDDNIYYFNYNTAQPGVDASPSKVAVQAVIQGGGSFNLTGKLNGSPATLYIIMVDHGNPNKFMINDEFITPAELDQWLKTLEGTLNTDAYKEKRSVIIGACYSGSFISALSKNRENRLIITSSAANEQSYKGPMEPDGIRSGEYFIEELFKGFGKGYNIKKSFQDAVAKTEIFTKAGGNTNGNTNIYGNSSLQHPLLEDGGDGIGTNILSAVVNDGAIADSMYVGVGLTYATNSANNPAEIDNTNGTVFLTSSQDAATLWATVNDNSQLYTAPWVEIRSPTLQLNAGIGSDQLSIDLPRAFLVFNDGTQRWENSLQGTFTDPGMYDAYYYAKDIETEDISPMKRSVVYKNKVGNNPPVAFSLLSPQNVSDQKTILLLQWNATSDPDGDELTYTVMVSRDSTFKTVDYRMDGLTSTMAAMDVNAGLLDLNTYYWKVQAIDYYGSIRESSEIWSFTTNNTNGVPGIIKGYLRSNNGALISGASITAGGSSITTLANGAFFFAVTPGSYAMTSKASGYLQKTTSSFNVSSGSIVDASMSLTPVVSDNGACGSSDKGVLVTIPTANLCTSGTPSDVSGNGPWSWSCVSSNNGTTASCSASIQTYALSFSATTGGSLIGTVSQTVSHGASATVVVAEPTTDYHFVNWSGTGGFVTTTTNPLTVTNVTAAQSITATFAADPINGTCGSDNSKTMAVIPTNLCSSGSASTVTGSGPWSWSCQGLYSGTNQNCSANLLTYAISTTISDANGTITCQNPVTTGASSVCTITPNSGYHTASFSVGGVDHLADINNNSYTITNITTNQSVVGSFAITQQTQTIHFTPPATKTYGDPAISLTATGGASGNPVTFTLVSGQATLSGNTLTITGVGSIYVRATQAGNSNYTAAPDVTANIVVGKAALTITAVAKSKTYGAYDPVLTYTTTGLVSSDTMTGTLTRTAGEAVGSYPITQGSVTVSAPNNYNISYTSANLTISTTSQAITFAPQTTATYGAAPITLTATGGGSGNPVTFSVTSGPGTLSGTNNSTLTITGVGTIVVKASQAGNSNYAAASDVTANIVVGKTTPTISWSTPADITYGTALSGTQLNATSGGVTGTFTYTPIAGTILNASSSQQLSVTFTPSDSSSYNTPAATTTTINVSAKTLTITANNISRSFGVANPTTPGFTAPALVGSDCIGSVSYTYAATATATAAVGSSHAITPSNAVFTSGTASNYNITYVAGTLNIAGGASQSITFAPPTTATYGDPAITLSGTASSGLPVSFTLVSGPATLTGNTLTFTGPGTITVRATQGGDSNYAAATDVTANIVVNNASYTVTGSTSGNGSIQCVTPVTSGNTTTCTLTPDTGYRISAASGCGTGNLTGTTYTTGAITGSCTVTASFAVQRAGDCDSNGTVTITEVQSAINMFLGLKTVEACVDQDNNSSVSIAEVQKVINSFLGL